MHGFGYITAACLNIIHQLYRVTTVLMSHRDADVLLKTSPEIFQPIFGGPKVCKRKRSSSIYIADLMSFLWINAFGVPFSLHLWPPLVCCSGQGRGVDP